MSNKDSRLATLVKALNNHCSSWLHHIRNASALNVEQRDAIFERNMVMQACLWDHESDAGRRAMDEDFTLLLADCMAGMIIESK